MPVAANELASLTATKRALIGDAAVFGHGEGGAVFFPVALVSDFASRTSASPLSDAARSAAYTVFALYLLFVFVVIAVLIRTRRLALRAASFRPVPRMALALRVLIPIGVALLCAASLVSLSTDFLQCVPYLLLRRSRRSVSPA